MFEGCIGTQWQKHVSVLGLGWIGTRASGAWVFKGHTEAQAEHNQQRLWLLQTHMS